MPVTLEIPPVAPLNALPLLVVCGFVAFDVVMGLAKAFATHSYESIKMREGLWHKAAVIAVVVLAYALESATGFMDFSLIGWAPGTTIPIVGAVTCYVILMEVGSIVESIVAINPKLLDKKLWSHFGKVGEVPGLFPAQDVIVEVEDE